jgi:hypothetical protein
MEDYVHYHETEASEDDLEKQRQHEAAAGAISPQGAFLKAMFAAEGRRRHWNPIVVPWGLLLGLTFAPVCFPYGWPGLLVWLLWTLSVGGFLIMLTVLWDRIDTLEGQVKALREAQPSGHPSGSLG